MAETMSLLLFAAICLALMAGYPVAFTLGGGYAAPLHPSQRRHRPAHTDRR